MRKLTVVLSLLAVLGFSMSALAAAPVFVPVQGYLTDADGAPVDAEVSMTLVLWDNMSGGTPLFSETQQVLVEQGFFTLYLGGTGTPALDLVLFRDHGSLFLGVNVNAEGEMAPRLPLGTVPYAGFAQYAGDALTLGGLTVEDFRLGTDEVSWDDLTGVPDTLLDGDADSLAGLACGAGQVAKWDGAAWACADDALGAGVSEAEVDGFVANNGYALTADLAAVAFSGDWNDLVNVPAALLDGDADTLAGIACGAGQVIKWNGSAWACADDIDTDTDTDTLADLFCAPGQVAKWNGNAWACADDVDTDTDTDTDTLAGLVCGAGQVAKWNGNAWACADDVDTDTTLGEAEVDAYVADNGYALAADLATVATSGDFNDLVNVPAGLLDGDDDTLAGLTCADGQLPAWDDTNAVWECVDDLDTDTLMTLACLDGQLAKWDSLAGMWACADDIDTDTDTQLTEAEVDAMVADNGYAMASHNHDAVYALLGHDHDADYAAVGHNHDAAYVNVGEANSINSSMIVDGAVVLGTDTSGAYDATADTIADDGVISDAEAADNLTINWVGLQGHPAPCGAGQAVTAVGDALTCTAFDTTADTIGDDGTIVSAEITDGTIAIADINTIAFDARYALSGHAHNYDATYVNEGQANSITSAMIVDNTVASADILDSTITTNDIAADTITAADIAAGAVGTSEIADNTILGGDIQDGTITLADINTASFDTRYARPAGTDSNIQLVWGSTATDCAGAGAAYYVYETIPATWPSSGGASFSKTYHVRAVFTNGSVAARTYYLNGLFYGAATQHATFWFSNHQATHITAGGAPTRFAYSTSGATTDIPAGGTCTNYSGGQVTITPSEATGVIVIESTVWVLYYH
ncbi:MAG TPA: hypothetical protein PK668_20695 [Myxococcota bacterium]|nr:hypothetical protein [Myxococcota bacterium]